MYRSDALESCGLHIFGTLYHLARATLGGHNVALKFQQQLGAQERAARSIQNGLLACFQAVGCGPDGFWHSWCSQLAVARSLQPRRR